jgi:hypothetical protein
MPYAPTKMEATGIQYNTIQFYGAVSTEIKVAGEVGKVWNKAVLTYSRYYPGICLEGLRNIMKTVS